MKILKYVFNELEDIKTRIKMAYKVYLFLDYDGTLTEIRDKPGDALPGDNLVRLLNNFKNNRFILVIISGRSLDDLEKIIGPINTSHITLIGSHGLEIKNAGLLNIKEAIDDACHVNIISKSLKTIIIDAVKDINNILIEDKPQSFAIHYRQVEKKDLHRINLLLKMLRTLKKQYDFRYLRMKKVIEIMPQNTNKGSVLKNILKYNIKNNDQKSTLVLCIGDDVTDEDLFSVNRTGINIRVTDRPGSKKSRSDYYLRDPEEVIRFLSIISHL